MTHKKHARHAGYVALMLPIDAEYWNQSDTIEGALSAADEDEDICGKVGVFECVYPEPSKYAHSMKSFVYELEHELANSDLCMDEDVFEVKEGAEEAYKKMVKAWCDEFLKAKYAMTYGESLREVDL